MSDVHSFRGCPARPRPGRLFAFFLALVPATAFGQTCDLKRDEEIVFFPAVAYRASDGEGWKAEVRGCVFEPEKAPDCPGAAPKGPSAQGSENDRNGRGRTPKPGTALHG
jgi:hypothetical protein